MKKVTSAALLAIKLSWAIALGLIVMGAGFQTFSVYRWLMPGGVPLQASFGFETMLRSAVESHGKTFMAVMLFFISSTASDSRGSKIVYTMNRLGLSENQMTLVFGAVFSGWFLLYWAVQVGLAYAYFVWYSQFSLVSSNAFMLACWRSEWLHILLPLGEWWGYLRNVIICLSFGFSAAFGSQLFRHGKLPLAGLFPVLLCAVMLNGRVGEAMTNIGLMVLLMAFTVGYFFVLKGGKDYEDL